MPYIITTATPIKGEPVGEPLDKISRRAVATLDDARETVERAVTSVPGYTSVIGFPTQAAVADAISEAGGKVGPLPDGTVIEVRRSIYADLADAVDYEVPASMSTVEACFAILGAYNAAQKDPHYGHCDTCGAPCDRNGCTNRPHSHRRNRLMWRVSFYGGSMDRLITLRFAELPEDRQIEAIMIDYGAGHAMVRVPA